MDLPKNMHDPKRKKPVSHAKISQMKFNLIIVSLELNKKTFQVTCTISMISDMPRIKVIVIWGSGVLLDPASVCTYHSMTVCQR